MSSAITESSSWRVRSVDAVTVVALAASVVLSVVAYPRMPSRMAVHWSTVPGVTTVANTTLPRALALAVPPVLAVALCALLRGWLGRLVANRERFLLAATAALATLVVLTAQAAVIAIN